MARYIVLPTIDPRGVPSYYIVDTSDNSRVRRYDCRVWVEHEARRMNGDRETEKDKSLLNRLYERLFKKGVQMNTNNRKMPHSATETARKEDVNA